MKAKALSSVILIALVSGLIGTNIGETQASHMRGHGGRMAHMRWPITDAVPPGGTSPYGQAGSQGPSTPSEGAPQVGNTGVFIPPPNATPTAVQEASATLVAELTKPGAAETPLGKAVIHFLVLQGSTSGCGACPPRKMGMGGKFGGPHMGGGHQREGGPRGGPGWRRGGRHRGGPNPGVAFEVGGGPAPDPISPATMVLPAPLGPAATPAPPVIPARVESVPVPPVSVPAVPTVSPRRQMPSVAGSRAGEHPRARTVSPPRTPHPKAD
jgi:hypothetical protein